MTTAKPQADTIDEVELKVFEAGPGEEWWVGRSAEDVASMNRDQCGVMAGEGGAAEDWEELSPDAMIPIKTGADGSGPLVRQSAKAWAKENGRGCLASRNF